MNSRQFGDFQTPPELVRAILKTLGPIGRRWTRVLEPTCGRGNFIRGVIESDVPPEEIIGIEIQDNHLTQAKTIIPTKGTKITIMKNDIFSIALSKDLNWKSSGSLLVIGNPPWVTNSEIGAINGKNLPRKSNFKGLRGIDAITGRSNFDIAEYIWIKLISDLLSQNATIALLCKVSVARKVLQFAQKADLPISNAEIKSIDAKKWFSAAVEACLFSIRVGGSQAGYQAAVFDSLEASVPKKKIGFFAGKLISNLELYHSLSFAEGSTPLEWRQGVKHDASPVMELTLKGDNWYNAADEKVEVESEFIYPLIKGSDIRRYGESSSAKRAVIVTQKEIGESTGPLEMVAPRLWAYLMGHKNVFESRKSSVYKSKPPFSIFGVGKYSFSKYKVIVSGLHKQPWFIAVGPLNRKPVFCDDTCYLLPCGSAIQAACISAILNHPFSTGFIESIIFPDAKRPITKTLLKRIDILALAKKIKIEDIRDEIASSLEAITENEGKGYSFPSNLVSALGFDSLPVQAELFGN